MQLSVSGAAGLPEVAAVHVYAIRGMWYVIYDIWYQMIENPWTLLKVAFFVPMCDAGCGLRAVGPAAPTA